MSKLKIIKQLEYLIAFQSECLNRGNWEDFDKAENEIKKLEEEIINWKEDKDKSAFLSEINYLPQSQEQRVINNKAKSRH